LGDEFAAQRGLDIGARLMGTSVRLRALALVAAGILAGAVAAAALARVVASLLTSSGRIDLSTMFIAGAVMLTTASVACLLPTLSATRVDPLTALKDE
jgi:ABC-type antimicrobial peptide transport system permease subunit